jgi:hypothetical protein
MVRILSDGALRVTSTRPSPLLAAAVTPRPVAPAPVLTAAELAVWDGYLAEITGPRFPLEVGATVRLKDDPRTAYAVDWAFTDADGAEAYDLYPVGSYNGPVRTVLRAEVAEPAPRRAPVELVIDADRITDAWRVNDLDDDAYDLFLTREGR